MRYFEEHVVITKSVQNKKSKGKNKTGGEKTRPKKKWG